MWGIRFIVASDNASEGSKSLDSLFFALELCRWKEALSDGTRRLSLAETGLKNLAQLGAPPGLGPLLHSDVASGHTLDLRNSSFTKEENQVHMTPNSLFPSNSQPVPF